MRAGRHHFSKVTVEVAVNELRALAERMDKEIYHALTHLTTLSYSELVDSLELHKAYVSAVANLLEKELVEKSNEI